MRSINFQSDAPLVERPKYIIPSIVIVFLVLSWGDSLCITIGLNDILSTRIGKEITWCSRFLTLITATS